jgi:hypothetical protein
MERYIVTGRVAGVPAGMLVGLSDDQARRRRHALELAGEGIHRTLQAIEFKRGEAVSLEAASLSKLQRGMFAPSEEKKAPPITEERPSGRRHRA